MSYDNNNRMALWKNDKKTSDRHPDYTGSGMVDNKEVYVSAWAKKKDANPKAPLLSISITFKDEVGQPSGPPVSQSVELDDDLPF